MPNVTMKLGDMALTSLDAGAFLYDGGAMFGVVPKVIWETLVPVDRQNRIELTLSPLLVATGTRKILVDVGFGGLHAERDAKVYGFNPARTVATALADEGLETGDIDTVVLTHLHSDHAAASTRQGSDGPEVAFENARYLVSKEEWLAASSPDPRSAAAYRADDFKPIESAGRLELVGDACDVCDGVSLVKTGGHTAGHMMVVIATGDGTAVYPADLIPMRHHVRVPYIAGVDLFPLDVIREKQKLLTRAADEGWLVILDHDPKGNIGTVVSDDKGKFEFRDIES